MNISWYNSIRVLKDGVRNAVIWMEVKISEVNLGKSEYICFELFEV